MNQAAFDLATLQARLGETVVLRDGAGHDLTLTLAEAEPSRLDGPEWEAFRVLLTSQAPLPLPQGSYRLVHPAFAEQELFVSPKSHTEFEIVVVRRRG